MPRVIIVVISLLVISVLIYYTHSLRKKFSIYLQKKRYFRIVHSSISIEVPYPTHTYFVRSVLNNLGAKLYRDYVWKILPKTSMISEMRVVCCIEKKFFNTYKEEFLMIILEINL